MVKRILSLTVVISLLSISFSNIAFAQKREEMTEEQRAKRIEKVRNGVMKLGTGPDAFIKVKVFEKNKKFRGYVKSAGDDEFTIVEKKTGAERSFGYAEVRHVSGKNLAFGTKVLVVVGSAVAATLIIFRIVMRDS